MSGKLWGIFERALCAGGRIKRKGGLVDRLVEMRRLREGLGKGALYDKSICVVKRTVSNDSMQ